MALSWNEIKTRAAAFSKEWQDASNEDSQAKPFLIGFFEVFGITNKRVATFEHAVKKYGGHGRDGAEVTVKKMAMSICSGPVSCWWK